MLDTKALNLKLNKEVANLYGCREEQVSEESAERKTVLRRDSEFHSTQSEVSLSATTG